MAYTKALLNMESYHPAYILNYALPSTVDMIFYYILALNIITENNLLENQLFFIFVLGILQCLVPRKNLNIIVFKFINYIIMSNYTVCIIHNKCIFYFITILRLLLKNCSSFFTKDSRSRDRIWLAKAAE